MIIVFVCKKNSVQLLDRNAFLAKQKLKFLAREPCIDENGLVVNPQNGCVTRTARSQYFEEYFHLSKVKEDASGLANLKLENLFQCQTEVKFST